MIRVKPQIRSIIKIHGGKHYLIRSRPSLIDFFPPHDIYAEGCAGALTPLLNKPKVAHEFAADVNPFIANLWISLIRGWLTPDSFARVKYNEKTFKNVMSKFDDPIQDSQSVDFTLQEYPDLKSELYPWARHFVIRNRFSRGGHGKDFAWSDRLRGGQPGDVNGWETFLSDHLPRVIERVRDVKFFYQDVLKFLRFVLKKFNNDRVFIYLDPPYPRETRTAPDVYDCEMLTHDTERPKGSRATTHESLLRFLTRPTVRARVMLSTYENPLYRETLTRAGWRCKYEWSIANNAGQTKVKSRRVEQIWTNYE